MSVYLLHLKSAPGQRQKLSLPDGVDEGCWSVPVATRRIALAAVASWVAMAALIVGVVRCAAWALGA